MTNFLDGNTKAALEAAPDGVIAVNSAGIIKFVNSKIESLTEYSTEELEGNPVELLVHDSRRDAHRRQRKRFSADPEDREMYSRGDLWLRQKSGGVVPVAINLSTLGEGEDLIVVSTIRDLSDGERRSKEDILLAEIAAVVGKEHEIDNLYELLDGSLAIIFQYDRFAISVKIPGTEFLERVYVSGVTTDQLDQGTRIPAPDLSNVAPGPIKHTSLSGAPESSTENGAALSVAGLNSWMEVPLGDPEDPSGFLSLRSRDPDAYSEADLLLLERIGYLVSPAFENARLYAEAKREAEERTALANISRIINSTSDIQKVYGLIGDDIRVLIPFDRMVVSTVDRARGLVVDRYVDGVEITGGEVGSSYALDNSLTGELLENPEPTWWDQSQLENLAKRYPEVRSRVKSGLVSAITAPLIWDDEPTGILIFRSLVPDAYDAASAEAATKIANQISGAVANAELVQGLEEEIAIREALAEISKIASATLDIDQVIPDIVPIIRSLMPVDRLVVSDVFEDRQSYALRSSWGGADGDLIRGDERSVAGTITEQVYTSDRAVVIETPNIAQIRSSRFPDPLTDPNPALQSWIATPLRTRSSTVGVMHIRAKHADAYRESDRRVAEMIGSHLAGALSVNRSHAQAMEAERARVTAETQNRELEVLENQRVQFLSTVSHELKTPLTSLLAFADFLRRNRESNLSEKQLEQVDAVRRSARRLDVIIDDLLDISRLDAGRFELNWAEFDMAVLIDEMKSDFDPIYEGKSQRIVYKSPETQIIGCGDRTRIAQVVSNLLSNANKYSQQDTSVYVELRDLGESVSVSVRDEGIGMTSEIQSKLFTPFFRSSDEITQSAPGTGLGLVITRSIIELHGGELKLESEAGVGTRVSFVLPKCGAIGHPEHPASSGGESAAAFT